MPRKLKPFDLVRVVSRRFSDEGVPPGTIGVVVDEYPNGAVEVEVSRPDGAAIALFSAGQDELEPVVPASLPPVPELSARDQAVFETLERAASHPIGLHRINHHLRLPTQAAADSARRALQLAKYDLRVERTERGEGWLVVASHTLIPTRKAVAGTVSEIKRLAVSLGGQYDKWEITAVK